MEKLHPLVVGPLEMLRLKDKVVFNHPLALVIDPLEGGMGKLRPLVADPLEEGMGKLLTSVASLVLHP